MGASCRKGKKIVVDLAMREFGKTEEPGGVCSACIGLDWSEG
jgi:hypothetical protein